MNRTTMEHYLTIMNDEMVTALGCTEPIAIAYAAAKAKAILGCLAEHVTVICSGNIVKNVKSVTVPNSGGMIGIEVAALLGMVGGDAENKLEVLASVTDDDRDKVRQLLVKPHYIDVDICNDQDKLYVEVILEYAGHKVGVTIMHRHTLVYRVVKDGVVLYQHEPIEKNAEDSDHMTVSGILEFAREVPLEDLEGIIGNEISVNSAISSVGLKTSYGAQVGKTILHTYGNDVKFRAIAAAAAGSDARMNGCAMPVVINSGSGNQGITVSLPVLEYAKDLGSSRDQVYRALAISNLVSIHIKRTIGDLSAFCGAVSAGCGAGAAICFLKGGSEEEIGNTIINTLGNVGGIICDGAKSSCAAKIASSVNAAILGMEMSLSGLVFKDGEGIVQPDVEQTIRSVGHIGRTGMAQTDEEILKIMLGKVDLRPAANQ